MKWFEVDREGLAKLLERKGKSWIIAELLQNAWDAPGVSRVDVRLEPVAGRSLVRLVIEDDSPEGFADLAHAFTLFGESVKKADPGLRGRFNLGEKLVLALCEEAEIASTTGTVTFDEEGRKEFPRRKRGQGTTFRALVRMSRKDLADMRAHARGFLPPEGVRTAIDGEELEPRPALRRFEARLVTETAGADGVLRRSRRKTALSIHEPPEGQPARLYEMGIPVAETGDRFDVDVAQKVPLSLERDAVNPAYLRDVRVAVLNNAAGLIEKAEAARGWVGDALADEHVEPEAVAGVIHARFGKKAVAYDPSDREANDRAAAAGYRVVHGGTFSGDQWARIRESEALPPAGRVTPTPKPFDPDGPPAEHVEPTPAMAAFALFCRAFARRTIGAEVKVRFLRRFNAAACYGDRVLTFNVSRLGEEWFEGPLERGQLDLIIHELGHEYEPNHYRKEYNDALTRLGAQATLLALNAPEIFDLAGYAPGARRMQEDDGTPGEGALAEP